MLADLQAALARRLSPSLWSSDEVNQYIEEGYDALCKATGCLWATQVLPDYAFAFNYTAAFEADYFVSGDRVSGLAQFTSEFERNYATIPNAIGPANHNFHWEFNYGYVTAIGITTEVAGVVDLPSDLHEVERATWNTRRIDAVRSRELERSDSRYELNKGQVDAYRQDKDGIGKFGKWRVPSAAYQGYGYDAGTEDYGVLRSVGDVSDGRVINSWGDLRTVDGETVIGGPWGVVRNVYKEASNVRIEYRRRGLPLSENDFEIPERCQIYIRHYVLARALEREGDGQDIELAAHYQGRFEAGVERMKKRKQAIQFQRKYVIGGNQDRDRKPRRPTLPWTYGQAVR